MLWEEGTFWESGSKQGANRPLQPSLLTLLGMNRKPDVGALILALTLSQEKMPSLVAVTYFVLIRVPN